MPVSIIGYILSQIRICEINRKKILQNVDNDAMLKEVPPKRSPVLDKNEDKIIAMWNLG